MLLSECYNFNKVLMMTLFSKVLKVLEVGGLFERGWS